MHVYLWKMAGVTLMDWLCMLPSGNDRKTKPNPLIDHISCIDHKVGAAQRQETYTFCEVIRYIGQRFGEMGCLSDCMYCTRKVFVNCIPGK